MNTLTQNQKNVLAFICGYIKTKRHSPTFREIAAHRRIAVKGACDYVDALKRKGYIKITERQKARSIEVLRGPDGGIAADFLEIPVLGEAAEDGNRRPADAVAAGAAVLVHKSWLKNTSAPYFALIARGDSMTGAGIMDGDLAILREQSTARNGDIIALELNEGYALKRYFKESGRIRLITENAAYRPVYCRQIHIAGILASVYRSY